MDSQVSKRNDKDIHFSRNKGGTVIDGQFSKMQDKPTDGTASTAHGAPEVGPTLLADAQPEQVAYVRHRENHHERGRHPSSREHERHHHQPERDRHHPGKHSDDAGDKKSDKTPAKDAKPETVGDKISSAVKKTETVVSDAISNIFAPVKHFPNSHGFSSAMSNYWHRVSAEKAHHRYEQAFPPVYTGMDAPRDVAPLQTNLPPNSIKSNGHLASLQDLVNASKDLNRIVSRDKTKPDFNYLALSEAEFKKNYAKEAVLTGKEYGLTKDQTANIVKRIYAFEDGGWGTYYTLSSMPQEIMADNQAEARLKFHPSSSAIGYNQLLTMDTVNDFKQHSSEISSRLNQLADENPARAEVLHNKAQLVDHLHDILVHNSTQFNKPPSKKGAFYSSKEHIDLAVQALNLDGDIGSVIQKQEFGNLLKFSRDNKFADLLKTRTMLETTHAAEYDKLDPDKKMAAVAEIMGLMQPSPNTKAKPDLLATYTATSDSLRLKFIELGLPKNPAYPDANKSLEREHLSDAEFRMMNSQVLTIRRYGGDHGPLSTEGRALLDKITYDYFGGYSAQHMNAAAIELINLAGMSGGLPMLKPENGNYPTSNFFAKNGYEGNPVTSRRSADELLLQIYRIMHGPNSDPNKPGIKQFNDAFDSLPADQQAKT